MKSIPRLRHFAAPLLALTLLASTIPARQTRTRQPPPPPRPADGARAKPAPERAAAAEPASVTLDEMFAPDAYAIYGEMRMVGQHVASEDFKQMLEPVRLAGGMPPDLFEMFDFIASHSEQLMSARVAFGAMPAKAGLPSVVVGVELPSAEEAQKFVPRLREFLAKSSTFGGGAAAGEGAAVNASADATPRAARRARRRGAGGQARADAATNSAGAARRPAAPKEESLPFHVRRAGFVVALADAPFTFRKLRGSPDRNPLSQEPGFAAARSRLSRETIFLYLNTSRMGAATRHQVEEFERRQQKVAEEEARLAREAQGRGGANSATNSNETRRSVEINVQPGTGKILSVTTNSNTAPTNRNTNASDGPGSEEAEAELAARLAEVEANLASHEEELKKLTPEEEAKRRERDERHEFENQLSRLVFSDFMPFSPGGGSPSGGWPESIGIGAAFEGDSVVVRAFLVSESEDKPARPIPFMPILHAGPQVSAEAANVLPADTDILVSASLDLAQMYEYVASMFKLFDLAASASGDAKRQGIFDSQVAAFERDYKFRIREDLINALGNEFAIALPGEMFGVRRKKSAAPASDSVEAPARGPAAPSRSDSPVFLIALNDKRAVQALLPRALAAAGVTGLSEQQLLQKQGDAEVVTFSQGSVAFIDRFLVLAFDPAAMKHVIDSYNEGKTLGRSREFRDPAGWQPRLLLGQAYVSSALLRGMMGDMHSSLEDIEDDALRAHVSRLDPEPGAITLAATKDAGGLTHELHVPKNLLALWTASTLVSQKLQTMRWNEARAVFMLQQLARIQAEFKASKGRYASMEEIEQDESYKDGFAAMGDAAGYELKLSVSGDKFEATATPTGYPKLGRRSFYIDQTGQLRGGDLGGRPASSSTDPVSY